MYLTLCINAENRDEGVENHSEGTQQKTRPHSTEVIWRDGPTLWGHNGRRGTPPNLTIKTQTSSSSVWSTVSNKSENSLLSCHVYLITMR